MRFVPTATIEATVLPLVLSRQFRQRREVFRRTHGLALRSIGAARGALAFGLVEILLFIRVEFFAALFPPEKFPRLVPIDGRVLGAGKLRGDDGRE